jgi:thioredoxin 1
MRLLLVLTAVLTMTSAPGCGGGTNVPVAAKPDTTTQAGAICDTTLDTTAVAGAVVAHDTQKPVPVKNVEPEPPRPKTKPEKVAEKPEELPKMWDFGSTTCVPCKTMEEILDPMMVDYKGKVDIRIINVYEEKELTKQFRIVTIPTQVFIDATGKELFRHIGVYPRDSIEGCFKRFDFPVVAGTAAPTNAPTTGY